MPGRRSRWQVYLQLGRVSNLPTVWTNCLAGTILAGGGLEGIVLAPLLAALSLFYTGGMFLNDAFDHRFDRAFRPERPIPAGEITATEVYAVGFGLLMLGEGLLALPALLRDRVPDPEVMTWGLVLGLLIIYYNYRHKTDPLSPLVMALCRALVYLISGAMVASAFAAEVLAGSVVLVAYMVGLTYIAKQENLQEVKNLWPLLFLLAPFLYGFLRLEQLDQRSLVYLLFFAWVIYALSFLLQERRNIPRAVISLIAGISLLDGMLIAGVPGQLAGVWLAAIGFLLTLSVQRYIPGT